MALVLSDFQNRRPAHTTDQTRGLEWLARAHERAEAVQAALDREEQASFARHIRKLMDRVGCGPSRIAQRDHVLGEMGGDEPAIVYDFSRHPHGATTAVRMCIFDEIVGRWFEEEYETRAAPTDLVHVTCTGYASPSAPQRLVAARGWPTRVTHAYHMGCYAAFPAMRIAAGCLSLGSKKVDLVHTELCTLHLDPADHSPEQLVVQSLFGDGFVRYSAASDGHGLWVLTLSERVLPDSESSMSWTFSDFGMHMTLARDVPDRIAVVLREVVIDLYTRAGLDPAGEITRSLFAVHPGGPRILDLVQERLELRDDQIAASRDVLRDHGNMSSATLPHVWMRLAAAPKGTHVVSFAFGPGLTVCAGLFRVQ